MVYKIEAVMPNDTLARSRVRRRIIDAALRLTSKRGYEGVQVRALSELAGVSSRTIYEHFPSLESIVIVAVTEQSQELYARFMVSPPDGETSAARVEQLITDLTETMTANRPLTVALLRALVSGKPDVARYVAEFAEMLRAMLATAIAPSEPTPHDREAAKILESIWFASLIGWATGTSSERHIVEIMRGAAGLILAPR